MRELSSFNALDQWALPRPRQANVGSALSRLAEEDAIAGGCVLISRSGDERQQRLPCFAGHRMLEGSLARVPEIRILWK